MKYFEPHSKGIKYTTVGTTGPNDHTAAPSLEEGQGLALSLIAKWTPFKWCLLFSVMTVFAVGSAGLITAIMTWFNTWDKADVMAVADNDVLILITLAGSILLFTSLIGITGTLLNSRPILAVYALLLWPAMLSLLAVGYTSYRRASLSLDHKLNFSWSRYYTPLGKRVIQDSLQCCGFYSSMHEASPSKRCYLRTPLPGCKAKLFEFERDNLKTIWRTVFSLAPLHLANMVVALLCANHITSTFGKGIIPKQYRLSPKDVKADADKILNGSGCDLSNSVIFREGADEQVTLRQKS
ncbi:Tetraspanin family-domain-containing protein [Flammula alnicola]|nr:Tetraspanin family-domain-containing protein [Flammula alnicola]